MVWGLETSQASEAENIAEATKALAILSVVCSNLAGAKDLHLKFSNIGRRTAKFKSEAVAGVFCGCGSTY